MRRRSLVTPSPSLLTLHDVNLSHVEVEEAAGVEVDRERPVDRVCKCTDEVELNACWEIYAVVAAHAMTDVDDGALVVACTADEVAVTEMANALVETCVFTALAAAAPPPATVSSLIVLPQELLQQASGATSVPCDPTGTASTTAGHSFSRQNPSQGAHSFNLIDHVLLMARLFMNSVSSPASRTPVTAMASGRGWPTPLTGPSEKLRGRRNTSERGPWSDTHTRV